MIIDTSYVIPAKAGIQWFFCYVYISPALLLRDFIYFKVLLNNKEIVWALNILMHNSYILMIEV